MTKRKSVISATIEPASAMRIVASYDKNKRREVRLDIGRVKNLTDLNDELSNFFFGECMVFSQISPEVNEWIQVNFVQKGGTPKNYLRMRELYEFYQALISDVDIRYDLSLAEDGSYDISNAQILGNDFYVRRPEQQS